ncbi:hypothetical protein STCU_09376 [Strigomonas culicis]|uniref:Uncharacterized protein n=1 Tax=Strigomonas culicis TaxID=28005 RepID=S9TMW4_9TRYP|nr:hypothetical protein STCU_09376 [Strigomonas culicis]|eukprot:EPY19592.1 hypothetical protein STCU_09376 [Strigomonas culicis]
MNQVIAWRQVEKAALVDRGEDDEEPVTSIIRSYLVRRGLSDTLKAFDEEREEHPLNPRAAHAAEEKYENIEQRKLAQSLCLQGRYKEAAEFLPATSIFKIQLFCIAAFQQSDRERALQCITETVPPLVYGCEDPRSAHQLYLACLSSLSKPDFHFDMEVDPALLAYEVNEALLQRKMPSALHVLLSWSEWLQKEEVCFRSLQ